MAFIMTHGVGEPIRGGMSGAFIYHILNTTLSVPINFPFCYWSLTTFRPSALTYLFFLSLLQLYCITNSIVPRWLPHSAHSAWANPSSSSSYLTCTSRGPLHGPWYLNPQLPCLLPISGQLLHCTASNSTPFHCNVSTPRCLPHLRWWLVYLSCYHLTFITVTIYGDTVPTCCLAFLDLDRWKWKYHDLSKCLEPLTQWHSVTYHKTRILRCRISGYLKRSYATAVLQTVIHPPSCLNYGID
jgi:hypothetical protein